MSQHYIEDLVEDSVRLVLASALPRAEQVRLIHHLYDFQGIFDTSDTTGRLEKELKAIGYVDGEVPDAPMPLLAMIATVMREAERKGDVKLAHHWLAMLIEGISDYDVTDKIPRSFAELVESADARDIRDLTIRMDLPKKKPAHSYIGLQSWRSLKPYRAPSEPDKIEWCAILQYFADTKAAVADIEKGRQKLLQESANRSQSPFHRLPELGLFPEGFSLITKMEQGDTTTFVFALDHVPHQVSLADGGRLFFKIEQNSDLDIIVGEFWVISGLLQRWQELEGQSTDVPVHAVANYFSVVPEQHSQTSKAIHPMGGWKYRLSQSEKILRERLTEMFSFWPRSAAIQQFHRSSLADALAAKGLEKVLEDQPKMIEKHGFFRSDVEVMFAFACLGLERGEDIAPVIARIEQRFETLHPRNQKLAMWREGAAHLKAGTLWFPPELAGIYASYRV